MKNFGVPGKVIRDDDLNRVYAALYAELQMLNEEEAEQFPTLFELLSEEYPEEALISTMHELESTLHDYSFPGLYFGVAYEEDDCWGWWFFGEADPADTYHFISAYIASVLLPIGDVLQAHLLLEGINEAYEEYVEADLLTARY